VPDPEVLHAHDGEPLREQAHQRPEVSAREWDAGAGEQHHRLLAVAEGVDVHPSTVDLDQLAVGVHPGAFTRVQRSVDKEPDEVRQHHDPDDGSEDTHGRSPALVARRAW